MPTIREVSGDSSLGSAAHYPDARGVHTRARAHCPAQDYLHSKAVGEASLT